MSRWLAKLAMPAPAHAVQIVQNVQKLPDISKFEHSEHIEQASGRSAFIDAARERAAIARFDGKVPAKWAVGFAILQTMRPLKGMSDEQWATLVNDAGLFLDNWGEAASQLGLTTLDIFGFHRDMPRNGIHASGLVALIGGNTVTAIAENAATIAHKDGVTLTYYRCKNIAEQTTLWELKND